MQATHLSLVRQDPAPLVRWLARRPPIPHEGAWATFLRNHDELTLDKLTAGERAEVFAAFGPDPDMQLYGRGIRRRLPTMMDGDQRWLRLAYGLMFALPGTPTIFYGEEIGMGENLDIDDRAAVRTPMQWTGGPTAGFSTAPPDALCRPVPTDPDFAPDAVNARDQRRDPRLAAELVRAADPTAQGPARDRVGSLHRARHGRPAGPRAAPRVAGPHGDHRAQPVPPHGGGHVDVDDADGATLEELLDDDSTTTAVRHGRARVRLGPHEQRWLRLDRRPPRRPPLISSPPDDLVVVVGLER